MRFDGIHHVTCITADAPRNVDFYTRVLGLRLVKKTVNQDDPTVYHLFYADEAGHAGSDITFFEYPNAQPGQAGDGMVHSVVWRGGPRGGRPRLLRLPDRAARAGGGGDGPGRGVAGRLGGRARVRGDRAGRGGPGGRGGRRGAPFWEP